MRTYILKGPKVMVTRLVNQKVLKNRIGFLMNFFSKKRLRLRNKKSSRNKNKFSLNKDDKNCNKMFKIKIFCNSSLKRFLRKLKKVN